MRGTGIVLTCALASLLSGGPVVRASWRPMHRVESLEWVVSDSDVVVVGRVTGLRMLHTSPTEPRLVQVKVDVVETLKGAAADRVVFAAEPWWAPAGGADPVLAARGEIGLEAVFCLRRAFRSAEPPDPAPTVLLPELRLRHFAAPDARPPAIFDAPALRGGDHVALAGAAPRARRARGGDPSCGAGAPAPGR